MIPLPCDHEVCARCITRLTSRMQYGRVPCPMCRAPAYTALFTPKVYGDVGAAFACWLLRRGDGGDDEGAVFEESDRTVVDVVRDAVCPPAMARAVTRRLDAYTRGLRVRRRHARAADVVDAAVDLSLTSDNAALVRELASRLYTEGKEEEEQGGGAGWVPRGRERRVALHAQRKMQELSSEGELSRHPDAAVLRAIATYVGKHADAG